MTNRPRIPILIFAVSALFLFSLLASSCTNTSWFFSSSSPSSWYPKGSAEISSFYEISTGTANECTVNVKISNTGNSKIRTSTITVAVTTSSRSYFSTIVNSTGILPGKSVYASTTLVYADPSETASTAGAKVSDEFYE